MAVSRTVKGTVADYSKNQVISEKNVVAMIKDWVDSNKPETIKVELVPLTGIKKGVSVYEQIPYGKDDKFNWKYSKIRNAINSPIPKNIVDEFDLIDLVGKLVLIDLVPSKDNRFQNVAFKDYSEEAINLLLEEEEKIEEEYDQNNLPFKAETEQTEETNEEVDNEPVVNVDEEDLPF